MSPKKGIPLERAVYSLIPELTEIRQEFMKMLNLFSEDLEAYREVIVNAGTQAEHLVKWLEESSSVKTDDISLMRKIENLQTGGILPAETASYLHTLRVFSNKARHRAESLTFKRRDVENILGILLSVYEWAYCDYEKGPRYPSIYRELPRIPNMIGNTIAPSGVLYCGVAPFIIEFRISNGTNYLAHGRSDAKMQDQRSLWDFRSRRTVFRSIALRSAKPSGALLERARSV